MSWHWGFTQLRICTGSALHSSCNKATTKLPWNVIGQGLLPGTHHTHQSRPSPLKWIVRERGAYPVSASLNRNKATQVRGYSRIFKVLSTTAYHSYNTVGARPQSAARAKRMNTSNQSHDYRELCSAHWCIVFLRSTGTLQKVATNVTARTIIKGRAMKRYHKIVSWNSLEYFSW